ncbi:MAG: glycosyltransferase [Parvularculaceae bacterium]
MFDDVFDNVFGETPDRVSPAPRDGARPRVLAVTTLYPNAATPNHGIFVENRLAAYRDFSSADIRVIAPVPWFPFTSRGFGRYGAFARAPRMETRRSFAISHPRYAVIPKIGMALSVETLTTAILHEARRLIAAGWDFDLIDAHYLYPDGVAAVRAARALGKPVFLTARGSDVTQIAHLPRPRRAILEAINRCDGVIAVADALKRDLVALGAPAEKITVLRNGVDLDRFRICDCEAIRSRMNLSGTVLLSAGGLISRKGHDIAISMLREMPDAMLLIAGDGPLRARLSRHAGAEGVAARVRFLGALAHDDLRNVYNAADALVLASSREGWPNVMLEAMACGAPVISSNAGGAAEVIGKCRAGMIVKDRTPGAFAQAATTLLARVGVRVSARAHAERHCWRETASGMAVLFDVARRQNDAEQRVHSAPLRPARRTKPKLLITVDTEEAFDWRRPTGRDHHVCPPEDIDRFQKMCAGFGARPLYFLTHPVLTDSASREYFRALDASDAADFGIHPHGWNTPPLGGFEHPYYSWQSNLPAAVHQAKLATLCAAFDACFGRPPAAHRAGRYGVDESVFADLAAAGLTHDFSPSPGFDFSKDGGPDFSAASNHPFTVNSGERRLLVTPASGACALRGTRHFVSQERQQRRNAHIFAPMRLTCEGTRLEELIALTRRLEADGAPLIVFSLHSTSLTPGANPYAPDLAAVDAITALTRRYLSFFTAEYGSEIIGFGDIGDVCSGRC